jgi:hypothetical protein
MSRFLKLPNRKTPDTAEDPAATRQDVFVNSVAALRKATGTTEARVVPCRCAETGGAFSLRFERLSRAHRFQIARIDKDDQFGGQIKTSGVLSRMAQQNSYDADEFDCTGFQCPHCGDRSGLVYCNQCRDTVCGGRVRPLPDGSKAFACHDGCGATGRTGSATHVHGGAGESRLAIDQSPLRLRRSAPPTPLLGGSSGRLPLPQRQ